MSTKPKRPPTPNQKETDAVAVKYYESGRKLEVEYYNPGCNMWCSVDDFASVNFDYRYAWRIKPTKRKVVVEIYTDTTSKGRIRSVCVGSEDPSQFWTLLGTIEGEVEG